MVADHKRHSDGPINGWKSVQSNSLWFTIIALGFVIFILSFVTMDTSEHVLPVVAGQSSESCPQLPDDGRPQPKHGANTDPQTWKVVPMKKDPNGFKIVDSDGVNVADRFHSKSNAEQYIEHFVCIASPSSSQPTTGTQSTNTGPLAPHLPTTGTYPAEPEPSSPDYNVLIPFKCQSWFFKLTAENGWLHTVPGHTCFELRKYSSGIIGLYAQQYMQGGKVYDNILTSTPLFGRDNYYTVDVLTTQYQGHKIRFYLVLDTGSFAGHKEFGIKSDVSKEDPNGLTIHYTEDPIVLGTW